MLEILRARLEALEAQRAEQMEALTAATAEAVAEERSELTEEERAAHTAAADQVDATDAELDEVRGEVERLEAIEARQVATPPMGRPAPAGQRMDPFDFELRTLTDNPGELRSRIGSALEVERGISGTQVERVLSLIDEVDGEDVTRSGNRGALHILTASNPHYRSAFGKLISGRTYALTPDEARAVEEVRAASLTDADGGYAVPTILDPTILLDTDGSSNPFRGISRNVNITGDNWNGVTSAGVTASWDAEATEVSDDSPTLAPAPIAPHKAAAFVPYSIEIGGDWANFSADIRMMFQDAKDNLEATAFALGTGSGQPTGVITALNGGASDLAAAGATIAVGDLYNVEGSLGDRFRSRAQWVAHHSIFNLVRQLDTSGGANLWVQLGAGQPASLLGYNTNRASAMDSDETTGNEVLIFGDWQNYVIVNRIGMSVELVPHLFATANNLPSGQRGLYAWWRVGADVVVDNAFRMLSMP